MMLVKSVKVKSAISTILFSLFSITIINTSVLADDCSMGRTPDGVYPIQESDIVMESEVVTILLESSSVECVFTFQNTGKEKTVLMGFPGRLNLLEEESGSELSNFKAFANGAELPVISEKSIDSSSNIISDISAYNEWFTFNVHFDSGEKIVVRNTYDFTPSEDYPSGDSMTGYILTTGAYWKGPIGSAKVVFELGNIKPYQIDFVKPGGFRFENNSLIWERENFEPLYDLSLCYNTIVYNEEFLKDAPAEETAKIEQYLNKFDTLQNLIKSGGTDEEFLVLYNKAIKENDYILSLYIKSFLKNVQVPDEKAAFGNINVTEDDGLYCINCDIVGPDIEFVYFQISRMGDDGKLTGTPLYDISHQLQYAPSYISYHNLVPGVEYTIQFTMQDWLDHSMQKTLKYSVPEQTAQSTSIADQSSDSGSPIASNGFISKNGSASEPIQNVNGNKSKYLILGISGIALLGLLTISIIMLRKKKLNQFDARLR